MAKEYFWGAQLNKDQKEFKWDPESEYADDEEEEDDSIVHFLFLKQAVLGISAEDGQRNVVEVETLNFDGDTVCQPLLSLKVGLNESTPLDIGLQPPVTFKLTSGDGPVHLSGQHALDLQEDEDFGKAFNADEADEDELEDELEDEEEDEEEDELQASPDFKPAPKGKDKKTPTAAKVAQTKIPKGPVKDEEEDDEEAEDLPVVKGRKRPAPSSTGAAKKLAKMEKDGKSKRQVTNGKLENGHGAKDEDDDDDEEDEDYKLEDEEVADEESSGGEKEEEEEEEEDDDEVFISMALGDDDDDEDDSEEGEDMDEDDEEEDEEEEETPEKPVQKAKGKVNGTTKKKGSTQEQAKPKAKGKEKKQTFSFDDMKQDLIKSPSKPKKEEKFKNFVKSRFHLNDVKKIQELWGWYKSTQLK